MRAAAARTLFDFCGCLVAGFDAASAWPAERAGRLALCAHRRDLDDLHHASASHPGGVVWSAAVACALERDAAFGETVGAAALGYEVTVRLGEALGAEHRQRWHVTTTAGTVGAAVAAASLLGTDPVDAAAHAVSVAGGSSHAMLERTGTRFLHRAHATATGVACARAARAGLAASRHGLESGRGALAGADPIVLLSTRPRPAIQETGFRLHAATGFAQAAVDAVLALGRIDPAEVERVAVTVAPPAAVALASNAAPADDDAAWWSIEHAVAVCLATGGADTLADGLASDPAVLALARRVSLSGRESGWGAAVEVALRDGRLEHAAVDAPLGHPDRPASDGDLARKWSRLTEMDGAATLDRLLEADDATPFTSLVTSALAFFPANSLLD